MVPLGKGNPISSGNLDTLVFLTEKPPPLSFSEGGGSMSLCTFELLNHKLETSKFSKSEEVFFENARKFRKNYYKQISRKKM